MRPHTRRRLLVLLVSVCLLPAVQAQTFKHYSTISIEQKLSQSRVTCILYDHSGFLWIGTDFGLNKYVAGTCIQYFNIQDTPSSLPSNEIRFILEDTRNDIWVGTSRGLARYDRQKDCFIRQQIGSSGNQSVHSGVIAGNSLIIGGVGDQHNIYRYDDGTWTLLIRHLPERAHPVFQEMTTVDEEEVLINTKSEGVYLYNVKKNRIERLDFIDGTNYIHTFIDSRDRLWCSRYEDGIYCYENGELTHHFNTGNSDLPNNIVTDMVEKEGRLWMSTDGGGIAILNPEDGTFEMLQFDPEDKNSFPTNSLLTIYKDKQDDIWAGSVRKGLISIRKTFAKSYGESGRNSRKGLSNSCVTFCFQDKEGRVWIATDGGGVNRFIPETEEFLHYESTSDMKITSIQDFSDDQLIFYGFNKGLFLMDKNTGELQSFSARDRETNQRISHYGNSLRMFKVSDDEIAVSGLAVFLYNKRTGELKLICEHNRYKTVPLTTDTEGNIYFTGPENKIYRYCREKEYNEYIGQISSDANDMCYHPDSGLWIATSEGIIHRNPASGELERVDCTLFNEARSVVADNRNRIWIGTRNGLYVYSAEDKKFHTTSNSEGILDNEFLPYSHCTLKDGSVMMGGIYGISLIQSGISFESGKKYSIEISDFKLDGETKEIDMDDAENRNVTAPWNFSNINVHVLLNNKPLTDNRFRFTVKKKEEIRYECFAKYNMRINNLPSGRYTVYGQYYRKNGGWSRPQKMFCLKVLRPWWGTAWFWSAIILVTGSAAGLFFSWRHRKKILEEQQEMALQKSRVNEERVNFLTNISHELKTPLTLVCSPLKRIINDETPEDEIITNVKTAYSHANHIKKIIDMILDVRKYEEGAMNLHIQRCDMNAWIMEICDKFRNEFEDKGIGFNVELDERVKEVAFDKGKCEFVLSNFLMNALKFSGSGSTTCIRNKLSEDGGSVKVTVTDGGMGLKNNDLDALFDNFYQGDHDKGGSGIGLFYAKELISYHKGKIGAENNEEGGASFFFELPVESADAGSGDTVAKENNTVEGKKIDQETIGYLSNFSILIAEDNSRLRKYLKETLKGYFAKIYTARNGKEGYCMTLENGPDIVVSDVVMPVMNGFEMSKAIKSNKTTEHIPVILLTAYDSSDNLNTGYKTGADAFLPKPFEIDTLLTMIYNLFQLRQKIKARYENSNPEINQEMIYSNAEENFIQKLDKIIEDNMNNPELNVNFIAQNMFISRSLLFNKVKSLTNMGIIDYVNNQRIRKACIYLESTNLRITEISELVGFSSLRYFTKVFKENKGENPTNYRKRHTSVKP